MQQLQGQAKRRCNKKQQHGRLTRQQSSQDNKGWDSLWCIPAGPNSTFKVNENLINEVSDPSCINPLSLQNTVPIDLAASKMLLCLDAPSIPPATHTHTPLPTRWFY